MIGIDGTNLSAILADPANVNLQALMYGGTTAASTIVGHTTISNPSWTGILTGVWGETAGVINNVFTPWTYNTWPTIFNRLEEFDSTIKTTAIADWENIAQIAGAGALPADLIKFFPKYNNSWLDTDDLVGQASVEAIKGTTAGTSSFQFSYFVGVDNTGHEFDAGSQEYRDALRNVDANVGDIMKEVNLWNAAHPMEKWTVLVTTDHGQVPWPTIRIGSDMRAHGFQTPWETTTFVIANGTGFTAGAINNTYLNIDVAPTVAALFGLTFSAEGMPLMDRSANDYKPVAAGQAALNQALTDAIAMYGYPDIATNVALVVRTIAATIPYVVYTLFNGLTADMSSPLKLPIQFVGAVLYQLTNIPAQIIARLTGVTGNQIIPPDLWPYTPVPGVQPLPPVAGVPAPEAIAV
ncbi:alkaline phosphatase family protein [Mycobacterium sp. EPa45]|uniref:alkaline phosphatase family protein n=1 Tax=Mycobacterium sp. EPa45 TaxID=1545728 RepID=UPI00130D8DD6|nr:alkaline phosphatase family protein [Mycobacterium sp. EPa45]